jgi:hypothetical protein
MILHDSATGIVHMRTFGTINANDLFSFPTGYLSGWGKNKTH